jgi:hypothetical protein
MPQSVESEIGSARRIIRPKTLRAVRGIGHDRHSRTGFDAYERLIKGDRIAGVIIGTIVVGVSVAIVIRVIAVPISAIGQGITSDNAGRKTSVSAKAAKASIAIATEFTAASRLRPRELGIAALRQLRIGATGEIISTGIRLTGAEVCISTRLRAAEIRLRRTARSGAEISTGAAAGFVLR